MNAYFFGRHNGELPAHLLRDVAAEHGIWAMGRLSDGEHTVYYAASVPESGKIDDVVGTVEDTGSEVTTLVVECITDDCKQMVLHALGVLGPCHIPGPPEWVVFLIIEGREQLRHLEHAQTRLGRDNVAAAYNGDGRFLVELASDDRELLDDVAQSFHGLEHHRVVTVNRLRGSDLQRV